jgi:hypothetical protein
MYGGMFFIISTSEIKEISKLDESSVSASDNVKIACKHLRYESSANIMLESLSGEADRYSGGEAISCSCT